MHGDVFRCNSDRHCHVSNRIPNASPESVPEWAMAHLSMEDCERRTLSVSVFIEQENLQLEDTFGGPVLLTTQRGSPCDSGRQHGPSPRSCSAPADMRHAWQRPEAVSLTQCGLLGAATDDDYYYSPGPLNYVLSDYLECEKSPSLGQSRGHLGRDNADDDHQTGYNAPESFREDRAIVDFGTQRLYPAGPDEYNLNPASSPDLCSFHCELASSDHLVLPGCDHSDVAVAAAVTARGHCLRVPEFEVKASPGNLSADVAESWTEAVPCISHANANNSQ